MYLSLMRQQVPQRRGIARELVAAIRANVRIDWTVWENSESA
jgi:hypothetical protein